MKVKRITSVGKQAVYDLSVADVEHYVLENGVITHNTGIYYSASTIFIMGRRQNKKGNEIEGYDFIINIEKSRYVKEKSKIPITVSFEGGLDKYTGLLDVAVESGLVVKPAKGWYQRTCVEDDKKWRAAETSTDEFWEPVLANEDFTTWLNNHYAL